MTDVINIFKQIQSTSSLNDKKAIIIANKDNELFKKCLVFLLSPNIVTGISDKKIHKKVEPSSELAPYYLCMNSSFDDVMDYLIKNNTGKDEDIYEIQAFLCCHEDDKEFYEQMITKKFRLGADAKLVNSCIKGLIPTFDCMLGTSIEKVKIPEGAWFSLSHKLNGNRCIYYDGDFYTRQGKKYSGLEHIKNDLERLVNAKKFVFDGELIYKNSENLSDSEAFQKGTGIAQSKSDDKAELKLVLFDVLPREEFDEGVSRDTYKVRKLKLSKLKEFETENLEIVNMFYEGSDQSEIWKWLDYAEQNDMEGLMLSLDAPYECKRTKNLIKVKAFKEIDLRCINLNITTSGKYKGLMGSISCKYGDFTVDIGSGFNDEKRRYYTENPNEILNHIITIKYKEETTNKNGEKSLQFPIFVDCRFDKDVADDEVDV
jgi:DNA ligase-1